MNGILTAAWRKLRTDPILSSLIVAIEKRT